MAYPFRVLPLLAALWLGACAHPDAGPRRTEGPAAAYSVARPAELPERITIGLAEDQGYLFAATRINGRDAGLFMVDTGASITVIEPGTANRLGLPTVGRGSALGVGGSQRFDWRGVDSLVLGGAIDLEPKRAAALSLHKITDGLGVSVRGIVGYRSFGGLPFTLDYAAQTLTLHRPDAYTPTPGSTPVRLVPHRGLPMVRAAVGPPGREHAVWLLIDTGAHNQLTLPTECLELWPEILAAPQQGHGRTSGVGGPVASRQTWVNQLRVMGVTLQDVPTNFEPSTAQMQRAPVPVGRIGNKLLRHFRLSFDPRTGIVHAIWRPGAPTR